MKRKPKPRPRVVKVDAQIAADLMELNWLGMTFPEMVEFALRTYVVDRGAHLARVKFRPGFGVRKRGKG